MPSSSKKATNPSQSNTESSSASQIYDPRFWYDMTKKSYQSVEPAKRAQMGSYIKKMSLFTDGEIEDGLVGFPPLHGLTGPGSSTVNWRKGIACARQLAFHDRNTDGSSTPSSQGFGGEPGSGGWDDKYRTLARITIEPWKTQNDKIAAKLASKMSNMTVQN